MDELPGPPFSQMVRGAFWGSLRASKNQKNYTYTVNACTLHFVLKLTLFMG